MRFRCVVMAMAAMGILPWVAPHARADGGFIPPRAYPKVPAIPGQVALIVFDQGMETLVVESTLESEGGDRFAWILPVPAPPETIDKVAPGTLQTLMFCLGPQIETVGFDPMGLILLIPLVLFSTAFSIGILRGEKIWRQKAVEYGIVVLIIYLLAAIAAPDFLAAGATTTTRVSVLGRKQVGNYDVAVLKASSAQDLESWLSENDFAPLPTTAQEPVQYYIAKGWVFVVARLEGIEGNRATPHPLAVRFPTSEAIYPMRLTAIGGTSTDLHLFVAGRERAWHPALKTILSDSFADGTYTQYRTHDQMPRRDGSKTNASYAHPELLRLVPKGFWLTRLDGALSPAQMGEDLRFGWLAKDSAPYQQRVYLPRAAASIGVGRALLVYTLALPVVAFILRDRRKKAVGYVAFLGGVVAVGLISFRALPQAPPTTVFQYRSPVIAYIQRDMGTILGEVTSDPTIQLKDQPDEIRKRLESTLTNVFEEGPIREDSSPGNYILSIDEAGTPILYCCDEWGGPIRVEPLPETNGTGVRRR